MNSQKKGNYAFVDSNNLYLGVKSLGWLVDYKRFQRYLKEKYNVKKIFVFIGFVQGNQELYTALQEAGFICIFKETYAREDGTVKGNCDAELVLHCMIEYPNYNQAVIVTGDGDFACLIKYLKKQGKLRMTIAPSRDNCSFLLRKASANLVSYVECLKNKLSYKKKSTP